MCSGYWSEEAETEGVKNNYMMLDADDRRMVRELILRLQRKAKGLKKHVIYGEYCG